MTTSSLPPILFEEVDSEVDLDPRELEAIGYRNGEMAYASADGNYRVTVKYQGKYVFHVTPRGKLDATTARSEVVLLRRLLDVVERHDQEARALFIVDAGQMRLGSTRGATILLRGVHELHAFGGAIFYNAAPAVELAVLLAQKLEPRARWGIAASWRLACEQALVTHHVDLTAHGLSTPSASGERGSHVAQESEDAATHEWLNLGSRMCRVHWPPEWCVEVNDFRISVGLVDNQMSLCRLQGPLTELAIEKSFALFEKVRLHWHPKPLRIVYDVRQVTTVSLGCRRLAIEWLSEEERFEEAVMVASPLLAAMHKTMQTLFPEVLGDWPVVRTTEDAVKRLLQSPGQTSASLRQDNMRGAATVIHEDERLLNYEKLFQQMIGLLGRLTWDPKVEPLPIEGASSDSERLLRGAIKLLYQDVASMLRERDEYAAELAEAKAVSEAATERLQARERRMRSMLGELAHDVRTPLTSLKLGLEQMMAKGEQVELHRTMRAEFDRLTHLFDNLSSMVLFQGQTSPLAFHPTDIEDVVQRVLSRFAAIAEDQGKHIEVGFAETPQITLVDPVAMELAVGNVVHNAIKYADKNVAIIVLPKPSHLVIRVSDDGAGIPDMQLSSWTDINSVRERVVDQRQTGLGLGLPIAREILRHHGGELILGKHQQGGARVDLRFPRRSVVSDAAESVVQAPVPARDGGAP